MGMEMKAAQRRSRESALAAETTYRTRDESQARESEKKLVAFKRDTDARITQEFEGFKGHVVAAFEMIEGQTAKELKEMEERIVNRARTGDRSNVDQKVAALDAMVAELKRGPMAPPDFRQDLFIVSMDGEEIKVPAGMLPVYRPLIPMGQTHLRLNYMSAMIHASFVAHTDHQKFLRMIEKSSDTARENWIRFGTDTKDSWLLDMPVSVWSARVGDPGVRTVDL